MKEEQVTMYIAEDGGRFFKKEDCEEYEMICERANEILKDLKPNDNVDDHTAIRQDREKVAEAWRKLYEVAQEYFPYHKELIEKVENGESHHSWLGRMLDDCDDERKFYRAYCRLSNIAKNSCIEYDQPYYADHENEFDGEVID